MITSDRSSLIGSADVRYGSLAVHRTGPQSGNGIDRHGGWWTLAVARYEGSRLGSLRGVGMNEMTRTFLQRACWTIAVFGVVVFTLLMLNLLRPALWTGLAVILALPAFIAAGILRTNDFLREEGFTNADIPTSKRRFVRSMATSWLAGLALSLLVGLVLYLARQ